MIRKQQFLIQRFCTMIKSAIYVFSQMFKRDFLAFRREFPGKFFDTAFMFIVGVVIFAYFMPYEGVGKSYGPFIAIGSIGSFGLFEIIGKVGILIKDVEGERTILQTLIMPVRASALFCYTAIFWAISASLLTVLLFPLAKLALFDRLDLSAISYLRVIVIFFTANLFYGFFALWLTSIIKGSQDLGSIFIRYIDPIWMFGAYFYSWKASYDLNPVIAYITLINPMVYIMEAMRASMLGQEGYLPFWVCVFAIWGFIIAMALHAIPRLKRRLDCV